MTSAVLGATNKPARSIRSLAASPLGWVLIGAVVVAALVVGSLRPSAPSAEERASYLDSVIKCPSCDDLSIAQSSAGVAIALRNEVRTLIAAGWSDDRIETRVEAQYGSDEVLSPSSGWIWIVPVVAGVLAICAVGFALGRARRAKRRTPSGDDEIAVRRALEQIAEKT